MSLVYLIHCTLSKKPYIGQTIQSLKDRWKGHCSDARAGSKTHLTNAIRKYGANAFELSVVCEGEFTQQELDNLEKLWIIVLNAHETVGGYNQTWGGTSNAGYWHRGKKRSPKTCEKIRKAKLGNKNPMFGKKNPKGSFSATNNPMKGKRKSKAWKQKVSKIMSHPRTLEHYQAVLLGRRSKGQHIKKEVCKKYQISYLDKY